MEKGKREKVKEKERKDELEEYKRMKKLLEDFPNLRTGGLLPIPEKFQIKNIPKPVEWTVMGDPK